MRGVWVAMTLLAGMSSTWAHLGATSFSMTPEGPYKAKDPVTLKWTITVPHSGTDIEYSANGGKSWTMVRKDYASGANGAQTYNWTLPDSATEQGMFRICQKQGSTGCTNADTVSRPSSAPYTLVSRRFSITAAPVALEKTLLPIASSLKPLGEGIYELTLNLVAAGKVEVIAVDVDGRETLTLVNQNVNAGTHQLSLKTEGLRAHPTQVFLVRFNGREIATLPID